MFIKTEITDFNELEYICWSGALDTLKTISEHDKEDEFMDLLEECYNRDGIPTETELNDYLWFGADEIFEILGIEEDE